MTPPTLEAIRAALACIPADLTRDEWARVAMALKSELGEAGFELFDEWSARSERYRAKDTRDTWRSIKAGGGVGIGTLFHLAAQHGYRPADVVKAPRQAPAEVQASAQTRAERDARDLADRETRQREAATVAAELWAQARDEGASAYLTRKAVSGFGVRYGAGGLLLVPMREPGAGAAGEVLNVQRIAPRPRADGGPEKTFLKGGRKSGLAHWCGEPEGAPVLLVAEGYATAATLHQATGRPVAVAFDAGNLAPVAKSIRKAWPGAVIVVCADDDRATEAQTGRNPGKLKATEAARTVRGLVSWPEGLPEGGSDFNDLAAHRGLDAVRERIEATVQAGLQDARAPKARPAPSPHDESPPQAPPAGAAEAWDRFSIDADGVWFSEHDRDGRPKAPQWVCSPLTVTARTRDSDESSWGYLLEFTDPRGKPRTWAMPARMLAGDGAEYRATLLHMGLRIAPGPRARNLLTQYMQTRAPDEIAQCTDRVGWHGRAFVLPRETLQREPNEGEDAPGRIVFQADGTAENSFRSRGTLDQWRERVAAPCVGNSRLVFAVSCAFAGPMLRPAGMESGGFHLKGNSSDGKTTAQRLAASVWGGASYLQRWRATDNALEAVAAQHCDGLLILDELAQVDPKTAGECAYMLANEQSKARSNRNGLPRPRLSWRLLFLSSGEIGLAQHMSEGGKRARAGQELRMADIPADAGAGCGVFENTHAHEGGAAFAEALNRAAEACHGTAGRAWLEWAVANVEGLRERTRAGVEDLAAQWVPDAASGQVHRVGRRFALVATAGELATEAGLTGWPEGEAVRAVRQCFTAWLESRAGGIGSSEDVQMLRQVRVFFEAHGDGRFTEWSRAEDDHAPKTLHRAGFRKPVKGPGGELESWEFFALVDTFRGEVCAGWEPKAVLRVLREREHLVPGPSGRFERRERLPGMGLVNCYRVKSSIFDDTD